MKDGYSRSMILIWGMLLFALSPGVISAQEEFVPFELRPYEVSVLVSITPDVEATYHLRERLESRLPLHFERTWGARCQFTIDAKTSSALEFSENVANLIDSYEQASRTPPIFEESESLIASVENDVAPPNSEPATTQPNTSLKVPDKVFTVRLEERGPSIAVIIREWDATLEAWGLESVRLTSPSLLEITVASAIADCFRPIFEIQKVEDDGTVRILSRGGSLPVPDSSVSIASITKFVRPFYRLYNRDKALRDIQIVPWTYLELNSSEQSKMTTTPISALRRPIAARRRGTVESYAIGIRMLEPTTTLTVTRKGLDNPFAGRLVDVYEKEPTMAKDDENAPTPLSNLVTDRSGQVLLKSMGLEHPVWVVVRSGSATLSRVPLLIGESAAVKLELPDDSIRLAYEGYLSKLTSDITDIVAKRELLIIRARKAAGKNEFDEAERLYKEILKLPNRGNFTRELNGSRAKATDDAQRAGNRVAERRIKVLSEEMQTIIDKYLATSTVDELKKFIQDMRNDAL
ncbi:ATP synthase subunit B family protein [Calycomorphotria hydatis]|uniref:Uncharacterized protein n=1 Tax=Calycomorphotria hydatis TaxID=2528027 RepID=A0A517T7X0_9PLAN|nr:ATP synthase F0 subunit B [Calycomorphotria hydatis]QDT64462.1 hypothetical protein V22_16960 [Calycomorphotria hydatis]